MGAQISTAETATKILNAAVSKTVVTSGQLCDVSAINNQTISLKGAKITNCNISGISNTLTQSAKFSCLQTSAQTSDFINSLKAAIEKETQAETGGFPGAVFTGSNASSSTDVNNVSVINTEINNMATCIQKTLNNQFIDMTGVEITCLPGQGISDLSNQIDQIMIANCTQKNGQTTKAAIQTALEEQQKTSSTNSGMGYSIFYVLFIVAIVMAIMYLM
jgi:hypothetical protein